MFFEDYFDYMDDMTPEQFYEFMGLIRDARFNSIDTNPNEIKDKDVRLAWRAVRPSILKSGRNARHHNKKQAEQEAEPIDVEEPTPVEESQVSTYTYTPEPAAPAGVKFKGGTQGEFVEFLGEYAKTHSKHEVERERNYRCNEYGYNQDEVIEEYNQKNALNGIHRMG